MTIVRAVLFCSLGLIAVVACIGIYAWTLGAPPLRGEDPRLPNAEDKIQATLVSSGASLGCEQTLTWHLAFWLPWQGRTLAAELEDAGYAVLEQPTAYGRGTEVLAARNVLPTRAQLKPLVVRMRAVAAERGIQYQGWTVSLRSGTCGR